MVEIADRRDQSEQVDQCTIWAAEQNRYRKRDSIREGSLFRKNSAGKLGL